MMGGVWMDLGRRSSRRSIDQHRFLGLQIFLPFAYVPDANVAVIGFPELPVF
jgi:hypothetical protein